MHARISLIFLSIAYPVISLEPYGVELIPRRKLHMNTSRVRKKTSRTRALPTSRNRASHPLQQPPCRPGNKIIPYSIYYVKKDDLPFYLNNEPIGMF